jgi:hypothetical protein
MFADSGYHATNSVHPIFGFRAGQELAIYAWAQTQPEFTAITNRATVLTNEAYFTSHDAWATNNLPDPTYATSVQAGAFDRANQLGALLFLYKFSGDARWTNLATRGWLFTNVNKVALWWNLRRPIAH